MNRELNEAIENELKIPSIINANDEFFDQNPIENGGSQEEVTSTAQRTVEEESKELKPSGKEIVLNVE